jgi:hypothetical protein
LAGLQESAGQNSRVALLAGARGASGLLRLRTRFGDSIATAPIRLEGNEWQGRAIGAWFQREEIPSDARVDIELESGSAHGYAEILDSVTQSRLLVSAAALPTQTPVTQVASRLMFSSLPTSFTAGTPFEATVQALRADNSIDPNFTGTVDLRVASGPGSFQSAVTVSQAAAAGSATFRDLKLTAPGGYTLTATATGLQSAVSAAFDVAPAAPATPAIVRVGTFAGQNGYIAQGTLQIERAADGSETLRLNPNFRVSSGAGAVTVWLARSSGALNTGNSLRVGLISRVFQGEFTFPIPAQGSSGFTHVIVYCDAFRINFGAAQLLNP